QEDQVMATASMVKVPRIRVAVYRQDAVVQQVACRDGHLRRIDLGKGEGAGDVDDDLDVDLADALERAPVKRVLVQELAGAGGLDMAAAELGAVALQQLDLRLGEDEGLVSSVAFEPEQSLVAGLEVVA